MVFETLLQHQLFVKYSKCDFGATHIEYLGHGISHQGVAMDASKVSCILQWPYPRSMKDLRGFLGLIGYYRRFIKNYGLIAQPLTFLLKKNAFEWIKAAKQAWDELKQEVVTSLMLALPNFSEVFVVESNALSGGLGAVLS